MPSLEETVNRALANGTVIPANIQAQLEAERVRGGAGNIVQLTARSDRDGHFVVPNLAPGSYTVQVERDGFFGQPAVAVNPNYPVNVTTTVTIVAGRTIPDLAISLVPGAAISGRVMDPDGQPVVSSNVQAFRLAYQNGDPTLQAVAAGNTDDRGDYRLYRIPPGEYYLSVTPGVSGSRGYDGGFGGGFGVRGRGAIATSGEALVRTFHPSATDATGAQLIVLRGGEDLSGVAITARRSSTVKVSGRVISSIPLPIQTAPRGQARTAPVQLLLVPQDKNIPEDANSRSASSVSMDSPVNGEFGILGVIPGSYDLYARVNNTNVDTAAIVSGAEPLAYFGRTSFRAGNLDVSGLTIEIRPGVEVKAYVTVDGSAAAAANAVRALLQPNDSSRLIPAYQGLRGTPTFAGPDGLLSLGFANEGLYRFQVVITSATSPARGQRVNTPGDSLRNAYVEDIREGGLSVYDKGLLVGKEAPRPIEIVIKTNGGSIQGTVSDAKLQPKAGAIVALVPAPSRRENIALYKVATSGDQGQFGMTAIPPGQYKLFAWESIPGGAYQNAAFISRYEERGSSINVSASSITNAQVTVIPSEK